MLLNLKSIFVLVSASREKNIYSYSKSEKKNTDISGGVLAIGHT